MNRQLFNDSLSAPAPPDNFSGIMKALWYTAKGQWDAAHNMAQQHEGEKSFDHLHAYLHRLEGDEWNAGYWYKRAGQEMPDQQPEAELASLIAEYTG